MPEVSSYPDGRFSWMDLQSTDVATSRKFYSDVFGWQWNEIPIPGMSFTYDMAVLDGRTVCGHGPQPEAMAAMGAPSTWTSYVNVDDVDATFDKAVALGAGVIAPAMDVMDAGRMAVLTDPEGSVFALWQIGNSGGAQVMREDGALCWFELRTRDVDAAAKFYGDLFGWTTETVSTTAGAPRYDEISLNGEPQGGFMDFCNPMHEGIPSHWSPYIFVDSIEDATKKVTEAGGQILFPVMEVAAGKLTQIVDPTGGSLCMIEMPSAGLVEQKSPSYAGLIDLKYCLRLIGLIKNRILWPLMSVSGDPLKPLSNDNRPISDLTVEWMGEELLVFDPRSDEIHLLSPVAAAVWQAQQGTSKDQPNQLSDYRNEEVLKARSELSERGILASESVDLDAEKASRSFDRRQILMAGAAASSAAMVYTIKAPAAEAAASETCVICQVTCFGMEPTTGTYGFLSSSTDIQCSIADPQAEALCASLTGFWPETATIIANQVPSNCT